MNIPHQFVMYGWWDSIDTDPSLDSNTTKLRGLLQIRNYLNRINKEILSLFRNDQFLKFLLFSNSIIKERRRCFFFSLEEIGKERNSQYSQDNHVFTK